MKNRATVNTLDDFDREKALDNLPLYLKKLLVNKFDVHSETIKDFSKISLLELGLDSIKLIELIAQIKNDLGIALEVDELMKDQSIQEIMYFIEINHLTNSNGTPEIDEEELVI